MDTEVQRSDVAGPPDDYRSMRACMFCSIIQTVDQFTKNGCPNCDQYLHYKKNKARVYDCTSATFQGMVAMFDPESSWVSRWQRLQGRNFVKGVYAVAVSGLPPDDAITDFEEKSGKRYLVRSRT